MGSLPRTSLQSRVHMYHKDKEGVLHSLQNFDLSKSVLQAIARGERSISTGSCTRGDLKRLRKIGLGTAKDVDLVIVFPWDAGSLMAAVTRASDRQLRRRVLVMALERIRRKPSLSRILEFKGLAELPSVRENPYLGPGHVPYENYIESLLDVTDTSTPGGDKRYELFLESAGDEFDKTAFTSVEEQGIRTVFHGTNHAVMDAILNSGLDPKCRSAGCRDLDYFGIDFNTSLDYTRKKTASGQACYKLLVFMIIVPPVMVQYLFGPLTVASNRLQLPLAEITLHPSSNVKIMW